MKNEKKINIAIVGLGNCASSLIQGIGLYKEKGKIDGLMHEEICGYDLSAMNVELAFDVDTTKIGKSISEAIFSGSNNSVVFYKNDKLFKNKVMPGPILDGVGKYTKEIYSPHKIIKTSAEWQKQIIDLLKKHEIDILVSYLPVGSKEAARFYIECALKSKVAVANAMPEFVCSDEEWGNKFFEAGVPCAGDDIKSQVGATILHRTLVDLIESRGQKIDTTFQLNVGGNTDFINMIEESRLVSKRISKTEAITKIAHSENMQTRIGPSDYVEYLNDKKICFIEINGRQFGNVSFKIDLRLSVEDSPNSAGVMVDVIRLLKVALDRKIFGYQDFSSYYFKHPKKQILDKDARKVVEDFIKKV